MNGASQLGCHKTQKPETKMKDHDRKFIRNNHYELTPMEISEEIKVPLRTVYQFMKKNNLSISEKKKENRQSETNCKDKAHTKNSKKQ